MLNYADSQCLKDGFCRELGIEDERIFGHDFYGFSFLFFFFIHTHNNNYAVPLATVYLYI